MKVGIVGCGVMGSAMARIIQKNHEVVLYNRTREKGEVLAKEIGAPLATSLEELGKKSDAVILAVKPVDLESVADDLDPALKEGTFLLSILVGTPVARLAEVFQNANPFALMPNLPLLAGKGLIGVAEKEGVTEEDRDKVGSILEGLGEVVWLNESLMNPFAALTGSSPAFVYLIIEAMTHAGITMGFKEKEAERYVLSVLEGAVALMRQTQRTPSDLRGAISSPGGTTIAGLNELEKHRVPYGILRGILRTCERGEEMEKEE